MLKEEPAESPEGIQAGPPNSEGVGGKTSMKKKLMQKATKKFVLTRLNM